MSEEKIKSMVDRFLRWKLPEDFRPDAGISFKRDFNEHTAHPMKHEPSGTNLLNASQAEAMIRFITNIGDDMAQNHINGGAYRRISDDEWRQLWGDENKLCDWHEGVGYVIYDEIARQQHLSKMARPTKERLPYDLRLQVGKALDRLVCDESTPEQVDKFISVFAEFGLSISASTPTK